MLSDEQITKFQTLYKDLFGKEISRNEAYVKGTRLIRLIGLIYEPMTETDYHRLQKRRQETNNTITL
jgi:hypothetical protein